MKFPIDIFETLSNSTIDQAKELVPEPYAEKLCNDLSHWVKYSHGRKLFVRDFQFYFGTTPVDIYEKLIWYSRVHVFAGYFGRFFKNNIRAAKYLLNNFESQEDFEKNITTDMKDRCSKFGLNDVDAIYGTLDPFWETGTEGIWWSLEDDRAIGYYSLVNLENGDYLEIYDDEEEILWSGLISLSLKKNTVKEDGRVLGQVVSGMYVHGVQKDVDPDTWMKMFRDGLRAKLIKKKPCERYIEVR